LIDDGMAKCETCLMQNACFAVYHVAYSSLGLLLHEDSYCAVSQNVSELLSSWLCRRSHARSAAAFTARYSKKKQQIIKATNY